MTRLKTRGWALLIGALALMLVLQGCGGDDNGGLSADDMARIDAATAAATMAQADADAAKAEAATAHEEAEEAKADAAAAQAEADAAKMAAEEVETLTADQAVIAVYEDQIAPILREEFRLEVGANPTLAGIRDAIFALAARYNATVPNTPAGLDAQLASYFGQNTPTGATAAAFFDSLRETGNYLPATRQRALEILNRPAMAAHEAADMAHDAADEAQDTGEAAQETADTAQETGEMAQKTADTADMQSTTAEIDDVYEAFFGPAVEAEFSRLVGPNPSVATIVIVIQQLASKYGVSAPNTVAGLQANVTLHFGGVPPTTETALAYFQGLRAGGFLPATQMRASAVITAQGAGTPSPSDVPTALRALANALSNAIMGLAPTLTPDQLAARTGQLIQAAGGSWTQGHTNSLAMMLGNTPAASRLSVLADYVATEVEKGSFLLAA